MELYDNKENLKAKNLEKVFPLVIVFQKFFESIKKIALKRFQKIGHILFDKH